MAQKPGDNSKPFQSDSSNTWKKKPETKPAEGWTPGAWPPILQNMITQIQESSDLRRKIYPERVVRMPNGKMETYYGPGLVDEYGNLVRNNQYDIVTDSRQFYADLSPAKRAVVMEDLVAGGFLDENSVGDYAAELNAMQKAFDFANLNYSTIDKAMKDRIAGMPIRKSNKPVRTYQMTNADDLKKIADKVAQDTIGRGLTETEAAQFVSAYQQQEVSYQKSYYGGGAVMQAPSPDVAAELFAKQTAPTEAAGYEYLGYANKLFEMIGVR